MEKRTVENMRGILIVNEFLRTDKFEEIYALLSNAAQTQAIDLVVKTNAEIVDIVSEDKNAVRALNADFCLFWDKDIYLAKRLENAGVRLFNSAVAIENCDDKMRTQIAIESRRLPTPKTFFAPKTFETVGYNRVSFIEKAENSLGYPIVIKEAFGSFGWQVYLSKNREETLNILQKIGVKPFLMQEFIQESAGKDLRVNVVGENAVCAMERYNERDFRSNVTGGGKTKPHELTQEEKWLAINACKAVGADFAGVDLLFGKDKMLVCEVNSNPHFKSTLDCTGVDLAQHIFRYIKERL
jgi:RimK family alpha-L-glutamate ligase